MTCNITDVIFEALGLTGRFPVDTADYGSPDIGLLSNAIGIGIKNNLATR